MIFSVLPKLRATVDELVFCRLSKKEQMRRNKLGRAISKIGVLLGSKPNRDQLMSILTEIRVMIRHTEVWAEEKTSASVRRCVSDLLQLLEELDLLIQFELDKRGYLHRITTVIKSLVSLLV